MHTNGKKFFVDIEKKQRMKIKKYMCVSVLCMLCTVSSGKATKKKMNEVKKMKTRENKTDLFA